MRCIQPQKRFPDPIHCFEMPVKKAADPRQITVFFHGFDHPGRRSLHADRSQIAIFHIINCTVQRAEQTLAIKFKPPPFFRKTKFLIGQHFLLPSFHDFQFRLIFRRRQQQIFLQRHFGQQPVIRQIFQSLENKRITFILPTKFLRLLITRLFPILASAFFLPFRQRFIIIVNHPKIIHIVFAVNFGTRKSGRNQPLLRHLIRTGFSLHIFLYLQIVAEITGQTTVKAAAEEKSFFFLI